MKSAGQGSLGASPNTSQIQIAREKVSLIQSGKKKKGEEMEDEEKNETQHLPHDIIAQHILVRLPIKSIARFKSVSVEWYRTLSSSKFIRDHSKNSPFSQTSSATQCLLIQSDNDFYFFPYDEDDNCFEINRKCKKNLAHLETRFNVGGEKLVLIGSCNGLVCLGSVSGLLFILWNPITHQFRSYKPDPDFMNSSIASQFIYSWGFGYVSSVDDYKVVRLCKSVTQPYLRVHVFLLRSNEWRQADYGYVRNDPLSKIMSGQCHLHRRGVLVNESLYWMGSWVPEREIVKFDLVNEVFCSSGHPSLSSSSECFDKFLCVMKGRLSKLSDINKRDEALVTILNVIGEDERIHLSGALSAPLYKDLIGFERSEKLFILHDPPALRLVDASSQPLKIIQLMKFEMLSYNEIALYVPSLVSPFACMI